MERDELIETLTARVAELERRMDEVLSRIGYLPGEAPIVRDESQWQVDPGSRRDGAFGQAEGRCQGDLRAHQAHRRGARADEARGRTGGRARLRSAGLSTGV